MIDYLKKRTVTRYVVVHFTGTTETSLEQIRQEHEEKGFREIGFHFVVDPQGKLLMGRHQSLVGAHHPDYDENSVSVCVIGERKAMGEEQELALVLLMDKLRDDYPDAESMKYIYRVPNEP